MRKRALSATTSGSTRTILGANLSPAEVVHVTWDGMGSGTWTICSSIATDCQKAGRTYDRRWISWGPVGRTPGRMKITEKMAKTKTADSRAVSRRVVMGGSNRPQRTYCFGMVEDGKANGEDVSDVPDVQNSGECKRDHQNEWTKRKTKDVKRKTRSDQNACRIIEQALVR